MMNALDLSIYGKYSKFGSFVMNTSVCRYDMKIKSLLRPENFWLL